MNGSLNPFGIDHIIRKDICSVCRGPAKDWKCMQCGEVTEKHNPLHKCGGHKLQPKCTGCDKAENNCTCK
mgnify:FL=1